MFTNRHIVQFYETDTMGVVHHSNYLRFCEEARVAWAYERGLITYQQPEGAAHLAVIETRVRHLKPARFGDIIEVDLQSKTEGLRIIFQYHLRIKEEIIAKIWTEHVPVDDKLRLTRMSAKLKEIMEKEPWTEI